MMTVLLSCMMIFGILCGAILGRITNVSQAIFTDAQRAVELVFSLLGNFCLWGGVMKVAETSGFSDRLARGLSPVLKRLFPALCPDGEAMRAAAMNLTANFLGLGNAATPLGITAMRAMADEEHSAHTATNSMAMFVVLNTASLQLLPTTTAMLRMQMGAAAPLDILPAVWLASAVSVTAGVFAARFFAGRQRRRRWQR